MKTLFINLIAGMGAIAFTSHVSAVSLSLEPTPQSIGVGDSTSMNLVISDLGNLSAPSLGAFDIDLTYNSAIISAVSLTFGTFLDLGTFGSVQSSDISVAGQIHLDEVSLEDSGDLNSTQPGSFILATIGFSGVSPGLSAILFSFTSLSDELGASFVDPTLNSGAIEVTGVPGVPDGGATASLLMLGFAGMWALRRSAERA